MIPSATPTAADAPVLPLLSTEHLSMRFGGVTAVNDVTFALRDGELRCLIGPNGAGKSTFFKCLTGQLVPSEGTILFKGAPISGKASHEIAQAGIGIKTQVPNLFNGLEVRENVWLAARRRHLGRVARELAQQTLERVGIAEFAGRQVGELAHGQRQLVELATVLAAEPELILLDEPAAGMTAEETKRTAEIIREINKTAALIVVEHDMQFIRLIADTVTVLHQGAVLIEDEVEVVMRDRTVRDVYLGKQAAA
jgi:branched-chain amino acid transport system ATP-binding protein/urea transport system ATP-binding protein